MANLRYTEPRMNVILAIMYAVFVILLARLFFLQVLSPEYSMLAMGNAVYRKPSTPTAASSSTGRTGPGRRTPRAAT